MLRQIPPCVLHSIRLFRRARTTRATCTTLGDADGRIQKLLDRADEERDQLNRDLVALDAKPAGLIPNLRSSGE